MCKTVIHCSAIFTLHACEMLGTRAVTTAKHFQASAVHVLGQLTCIPLAVHIRSTTAKNNSCQLDSTLVFITIRSMYKAITS